MAFGSTRINIPTNKQDRSFKVKSDGFKIEMEIIQGKLAIMRKQEKDIVDYGAKVEELKATVKNTVDSLNKKKAILLEINKLKTAKDTANKELNNKAKELKIADGELSDIYSILDRKKEDLLTLSGTNDKILKNLDIKKEEREVELNKINEEISKSKSLLKETKTEKDKLSKEIEQLKIEEKNLEEKKFEIIELKILLKEYKTQVLEFMKDRSGLLKELEDLNKEKETKSKEIKKEREAFTAEVVKKEKDLGERELKLSYDRQSLDYKYKQNEKMKNRMILIDPSLAKKLNF